MAEFQFRIEDLKLWAPREAETLQWPDRVPIYDQDLKTEHRAFLTGHTYVYTLPHEVEEVLKVGGGEILPHFESLPDDPNCKNPSQQRLTYLVFNKFKASSHL